jgi:rare lipoprotein A
MSGKGVLVLAFCVLAALTAGIYVGTEVGVKIGEASIAPQVSANRAELDELRGRLDRLTEALSHEGWASWYGDREAGRLTASMTIFDPEGMTAASKSLPFGTTWRVTRLDTGASCVVVVTDDGPNVRGRILDLSYAAARSIGMVERGLVKVRVEPHVGNGEKP